MSKTTIWTKVWASLCLFLMLGFVACNDDDAVVEVFDEERFFTDFNADGWFDDWDLDNDALFDENEFNTSFFDTWDLDNDGILEENEFNTVRVDFDADNASWAAWDTDADGVLEVAEFNAGFDAYGYYDTWDLDNDGFVAEREYTDGIYGFWDVDGDGVLTETEYNTFYDRYYLI